MEFPPSSRSTGPKPMLGSCILIPHLRWGLPVSFVIVGSIHGGQTGSLNYFRFKVMQMIPLLAACRLWCRAFPRKKIIFHCNNLGVSQAWEKLCSGCRNVLAVTPAISFVVAGTNFTLSIKHISGCCNQIADAPSRFQMSRFWVAAPLANPPPDELAHVLTQFRKYVARKDTASCPQLTH